MISGICRCWARYLVVVSMHANSPSEVRHRRAPRTGWCGGIARSGRGPSVAKVALDLEIFLQPEHAVLAPVAGMLVAADRRVGRPRRVVDVHLPRADPARDAARCLLVRRLAVAAEAIARGIGDADG